MLARAPLGISAFLALAACEKAPPAMPPPPPSAPQAPAQPASAPAAASPVTGKITLAEGLGPELVTANDVLFVMARRCAGDCTKPGSLVAVQRIAPVSMPASYAIGPQQVMVQGSPFEGPFVLQVRLDRDGDPMTKGPDDLYAENTSGVQPGQAVDLALGKTPTTPPVNAAPPPPDGQAPAGHGGGAALPPGHPPAAPAAPALPPGHPPAKSP